MTPLVDRPRAIAYDDLAVGDEGYWPVLCAVPDDLEPGDRLHFEGDELGDVVAVVDQGPGWPCLVRVTTVDGRVYQIGRAARGFRLDRWGTSSSLSRRGAR